MNTIWRHNLCKVVVLVTTSVLYSSCASPYKSEGLTGGFTDTRLRQDIFKVNFRGNGFTSDQRAYDLALLRTADLCLQHGFSHLIIISDEDASRYGMMSTPSYMYGSASSGYTYISGTSGTLRDAGRSISVQGFKGKPEGRRQYVLDARFLSTTLREKYKIKASSTQD